MKNIMEHLDTFYNQHQYQEAHEFMLKQLQFARQNHNKDIALLLYNELIGYYRVKGMFDFGDDIIGETNQFLQANHFTDIEVATTYLNMATYYRVQGQYQDAEVLYLQTLSVYQEHLEETDERFIALYNNMSLLFHDQKRIQDALEYEYKALSLMESQDDFEVEKAITYTNLSAMHTTLKQMDQALVCLNQAKTLFETYAPHDPHYFATLASEAQLHYISGDIEASLQLYQEVLKKIEETFGKNQDYDIVYQNFLFVQNKRDIQMMEE